MSMEPIPIPAEAAAGRPELRPTRVGPPPGVSDEDCGTVDALTGVADGMPMWCNYWRPTPEQMEALICGGFIELVQYAPQMVMHSLGVWSANPPEAAQDDDEHVQEPTC